MPYTNTELFQRDFFPTSTDAVFPRLIERAATMAANYIDSRLASVYTVPFTSPYPGFVVDISDLLTKCIVTSLQSRRTPILPKPGAQKRDQVDGDCSLAILWLDDIVSGTAEVPGVPAIGTGHHTRHGYTPIFDVDDATQHRPDPDLLRKISTERDD